MDIELIKENIEGEQLLGENSIDTLVREEYIIPDTNPDVFEVLALDAKTVITNKEAMQDKVFLEGQVEYNVIYLAKEDDNTKVFNVKYLGKFSNYIEISKVQYKMLCMADSYVEHMECSLVNERKISIEGIIKLKAEVYNDYNFEVVQGVKDAKDVQFLKEPIVVDRSVGNITGDLVARSHIHIDNDKPQIGTILKCEVNVHKKETKLQENKVAVTAFVKIGILYNDKDNRELVYVDDDVLVTGEMELQGIDSTMDHYTDYKIDAVDYDTKEDDLGENRLIDIEALIKATTKVNYKDEVQMIEDAYSPAHLLDMERKDYDLNVNQGHSYSECVVKGNIEVAEANEKPAQIIMSSCTVGVTDKKVVEDKVVVDGLLNVEVVYRTYDEVNYINIVKDEVPFTISLDIPGSKIDMDCTAKVYLESLDAAIEVNTIAIKGIVGAYASVNSVMHRNFLVGIEPLEGEKPAKKSSITIYVVQPNDSIWKIAKHYFTTIDVLMDVNNIDNSESLKAGQKLIIPGRAIIS
jgi:LysM repeat protein